MNTIAELNDSLIGRYLVKKEIGQGGMATVYLARDVRHDRKVAIKVIHPELAAVLGPERFVTEMKVTANLQHPHILPLFDSGTARNQLFYVMPYVEGESLRDKLTREQQLPIEEAVRITTQVSSALDYAHRHGVVHRDIKPENILLHEGTALVADFGIALAVSNAGGTRLTQTGLSLGTPQYMSPEQATGDKNIDGRTDVYSLGCVLYEMLTGEPPFTGPNSQAIVARVLTEQLRPVRTRRDTVTPLIDAAVIKSLQKTPADRFATPSAFAEALKDDGREARGEKREARTTRHSLITGPWSLFAIVAMLLAYFIGRHATSGRAAVPAYSGRIIAGPQVAMYPRISPDGKLLAFMVMVGQQTQVGVLNLASGDWKVLTTDSTSGVISSISWSRDGSHIYYGRWFEVPRGIYSISALGGDNRLVLADADSPEELPDGSLLVWRLAGSFRAQLFHYSPQSGELVPMPAFAFMMPSMRLGSIVPGAKEVVFLGGTSAESAGDTLFAMDLATRRMRILTVNLPAIETTGWKVTADGQSVIVATHPADDNRVIRIPMDGTRTETTIFTTTSTMYALGVAADGSVYVDQLARPVELVHYSPGTGRVQRTSVPGPFAWGVLPLPDGRVLAVQGSGGPNRVVAMTPGANSVPFLASIEEGAVPLAMLGADQVMMRTVDSGRLSLTIANAHSGQIVRRLRDLDGASPKSVLSYAGAPDGKTIYFYEGGTIWGIPDSGGVRKAIRKGNSVAVDPFGKFLVIQSINAAGVELYRVPLDGTPEQLITYHGDVKLAITGLTSNAVGPDGRILVSVVSPGSWTWPAAILDPRTGNLTVIPPERGYDVNSPGWATDGQIVAAAVGVTSTLWRFSPEMQR